MRHFGNAHYGGWYKSKNTSHRRYFDFLVRLKNEFDARGLYRKRDAVSSMITKLAAGKSPKEAQKASKTSGYSPPLYSEFNLAWEASQDTEALVEAFASGDDPILSPGGEPVAVMNDDGEFESDEAGAGPRRSSGSDYQERMAERLAERQARIASGETFQGRRGQAASLDQQLEEESFFARYQTPIVIGSALALAGGAYYFFVVRD